MTAVAATPHFDRTSQNAATASRVVWMSSLPWMVIPAVVIAVVLGFAISSWVVGPLVGLLIGISVGVARTVMLRAASTVGLRTVMGGRPIENSGDGAQDDARHQARFMNLIEGLCVSTGTEEPLVVVIDDPHLNLAVFGPSDDATLVATSGLLANLSRIELEGVIAAALWRIRTGDAALAGLVSTFRSGAAMRQPVSESAPSSAAMAKLSAPFDEYRHVLCDLGAVSITRYPPGLLAALERMELLGTSVSSATWGTAALWMCNPSPLADNSLHCSVGLRTGVLAEL